MYENAEDSFTNSYQLALTNLLITLSTSSKINILGNAQIYTFLWHELALIFQQEKDRLHVHKKEMIDIWHAYAEDFLTLVEGYLQQFLTFKIEDGPHNLLFKPDKKDQCFVDTSWKAHPFFSFLMQSHILTDTYLQKLVGCLFKSEDAKLAKKVEFCLKYFTDALSPSNFILANPVVFKKALNTKGKSPIGLKNLLEDYDYNSVAHNLVIKTTNLNVFKIGVNLATTPGKIIYQNSLIELIQYYPQTKKTYQRPLLMIPSCIGKYYILDLRKENSLVRWLVNRGYTVFIISWINPDASCANKSFIDYILEGPIAALDAIEAAIGQRDINAFGYCIGGTILASALAYLEAKKDNRIKSATYVTTMVDFSEPGALGYFITENNLDKLEQAIDKKGYLAGSHLNQFFSMLRSNNSTWPYYIKNYLQGKQPVASDFLFWNADPTNLSAKFCKFLWRDFFLHNKLIDSHSMKVGNISLDSKKVSTPLYIYATQADHIVPWQACYSSIKYHVGPAKFILGESGHVAGVINPPRNNKYAFYVNEGEHNTPEEFLNNAIKNSGSWWRHWEAWMKTNSGEKILAKKANKKTVHFINEAPGSYVKT